MQTGLEIIRTKPTWSDNESADSGRVRAVAGSQEIDAAGKRILIVEDDRTMQPIFAKVLSLIAPEIELNWASSAERFLSEQVSDVSAYRKNYDLVITDIYMPGDVSGFDIWNHFTKRSPETPVVMMSGLTHVEFCRSMGRNAIAPAYLEKPLDLRRCRTLIEGFLRRPELRY